jgi:hypothetical protein
VYQVVEPGYPVGILTRLRVGHPKNWGSIPSRGKRFLSLLHNVQTSSGTHPASYTVGAEVCFLGGKAAEV